MRVLITGAAAGLAQGVALAAVRDGHEVVFTFRPDGTPPDQTLALLAGEGFTAQPYPVEFLGDEAKVQASLRRVLDRPVQAVVHAVGPMIIKRFEKSSMADYHEMIDGNLRSAVLTATLALPAMRAAGFGRMIFFGMNGSSQTQPLRAFSLHVAAKAGLVAFARTLALEEAQHGITVNVVEPGDVREKTLSRNEARSMTAQNPRGRPGTWEDVADAVRFFLDPEHDFINGAVLSVTGGAIA